MNAPGPVARHGVWRVFLLSFVLFAYFMPRWADWNIDSRFDLVRAIVDDHSLRIDRYHQNTWDKATYRGHFYSDKAPGTAFLGAVVYAGYVGAKSLPIVGNGMSALERNHAWDSAVSLGRTNTQGAPAPKGTSLGGCQRTGVAGNVQYIPWGNRLYGYTPAAQREWALSKYVVTVGVDALISALFVAFFFWFLGFFTASTRKRWLLAGLFATGTIAFPYSTLLYSHQLVAASLFAAFALILLRSRGLVRSWAPPTAGLLLGFSLLTEYTVVLIVGAVGIYALWKLRDRPREVATMCALGALPVFALLTYNYQAFGGAFDTGYSHDWCWSAAQAAGYAGFTRPQAGPLWDLTFGAFRGLFYLSPFLLLALPGAWIMVRRGAKSEALLCVGAAALFIVVISAYWGWNGGKVEGPRYLVPIVPFLAFPIVYFLERLRTRSVGAVVLVVTGLWSVIAIQVEFLGGLLFPISWLRNPIPEYSLPELAANHIPPNAGFFLNLSGWQSLVPLAVLLVVVAALPGRRPRRAPATSISHTASATAP